MPTSDTDALGRRVHGLLNKLTPEKFDALSEQLCTIQYQDQVALQTLVRLIFDMALLQGHYCKMYAELCSKLNGRLVGVSASPTSSPSDPQPATFRRALLSKCQPEFENRDEAQMTPIDRKRKLGNIRFVGELFKMQMLPEKIILRDCIMSLNSSIHKLSDVKDQDVDGMEKEIEALCQLLTTVGEELHKKRVDLSHVFRDLNYLVSGNQLSSRIRFMIMDIIDLRSNGWVPRRKQESAKKLDQIKEDVLRQDEQNRVQSRDQYPRRTGGGGAAQQQHQQDARHTNRRNTQQPPSRRGTDDRQAAPRHTPRALQTMDMNMNNFGRPRTLDAFMSRGPPQAEEPVSELTRSMVTRPCPQSELDVAKASPQDLAISLKRIVGTFFVERSHSECAKELLELMDWQERFVVEATSLSFDMHEPERNALVLLFQHLVGEGVLTMFQLLGGLQKVASEMCILKSDVPQVAEMFGQVLGHCIAKKILYLDSLSGMVQPDVNEQDLKTLITHCLSTLDVSLGHEEMLIEYCNGTFRVESVIQGQVPDVVRVEWMSEYEAVLGAKDTDNDRVLKWIQDRMNQRQANSSVLLTDTTIRCVLSDADSADGAKGRLTHWVVVLRRVCHAHEQQLAALSAIQRFCRQRNVVKDMCQLVRYLYDQEVVIEQACREWAKQHDAQGNLESLVAFLDSAHEE